MTGYRDEVGYRDNVSYRGDVADGAPGGGGTTGGGGSPGVTLTGTFTFSPRVIFDIPSVDESRHGVSYKLFRYYGLRPRGENVWRLVDGTFSDTQPYPLISVADAARQSIVGDATYVDVFYGGHVYDDLSPEDALALQAQGLATLGLELFPNGFTLPPGTGLLLSLAGDVLVVENADGDVLLELV